MKDCFKLRATFKADRLREEAGQFQEEFVPHFNRQYYEGDWSVIPLQSVGGRPDHIYPDPTGRSLYAPTPLLDRCPYAREVLGYFECEKMAVRFLRLKAGSSIKEHTDLNLGFEDGEVRLHIPVQTHPEVEFILNQSRVEMAEGECWYLNFNLPHRVANRSPLDRLHLVIDCRVNAWLAAQLKQAEAALP